MTFPPKCAYNNIPCHVVVKIAGAICHRRESLTLAELTPKSFRQCRNVRLMISVLSLPMAQSVARGRQHSNHIRQCVPGARSEER